MRFIYERISNQVSDHAKDSKRKTARKIDIAIIILAVIAAICFFCLWAQRHSSEAKSAPVTMESYNGKTLGAMAGSTGDPPAPGS